MTHPNALLQGSDRPGISGIAVDLPAYRVELRRFAHWYGNDPRKLQAVVGESFRMPAPDEDAYTLAANAVLRLLDAYQVDPQAVGMLVLATESSEDNAVGAVIVRGMVDRALVARGGVPLRRDCEVPEVKHACLAGVYGLAQALRYVALDGRSSVAIVVASDVARYARGSTGEPTQGAGAVAMLVEPRARLCAVDLPASRGASLYRGADFRKPVARFRIPSYVQLCGRHNDVPVFNGRYSTACYSEAVAAALHAFGQAQGVADPWALIDAYDRVYCHRPYAHMPVQGIAFAMVYAAARNGVEAPWFLKACKTAEVRPEDVRADAGKPAPGADGEPGDPLGDPWYPKVEPVARALRRDPAFSQWIGSKMELGSAAARHFGNLYAASLPAGLAAALSEAARAGQDVSGERWLAVGYGSGDAAEILPLEVSPGAMEAARRIRLDEVLAVATDVDQAAYEALHGATAGAEHCRSRPGTWVITARGDRVEGPMVDAGIPYYELLPS